MAGESNGLAAKVEMLERGQTEIFERLRAVDRMEVTVTGMAEDIAEMRKTSETKAQMSTAVKVALIGAFGAVLAAIVIAIATLAGSGVI